MQPGHPEGALRHLCLEAKASRVTSSEAKKMVSRFIWMDQDRSACSSNYGPKMAAEPHKEILLSPALYLQSATSPGSLSLPG